MLAQLNHFIAQPSHVEELLSNLTTCSTEQQVAARNYLYNHQADFVSSAPVHYVWGKLEQMLGMPDAAIQCFHNALAVDAQHSESLRELGFMLNAQGQAEQAFSYFERIVQHNPNDWMAWNDGGCTLRTLNQREAALFWMKQAFAACPQQASLAANSALLAYELNDYALAQDWLDTALALDAHNAEALHTQAMLFASTERFDEARTYEYRALASNLDYPQVRLSLALLDLTQGNWLTGFAGYEYRWVGSDKAGTQTMPSIGRPQWRGQAVYEGSTIAILSEQGFGDIVQMAQLIPLLSEPFHRIIWQVPSAMYRLMYHSVNNEQIQVVQQDAPLNRTRIDFELPMMSLPFALGLTLDNFSALPNYLSVPNELSQHFAAKLANIHGLKVGLAWTGKPSLAKQALRRVPTELLSLLITPGVTFVSLQKFDAQHEIETPNLAPFVDLMTECQDFMDTAALIQQLDLVISVDTVIVHLAAALGKPTWLLNRFGSEWRWMHQRSDSPWYPSLTIYNQTTFNDWTGVLTQVQSDLIQFSPVQESCHV
ncbi:MAG: hypothetical protein JHC38_11405 [Thiotrichales bacterium]|nr:hypothetical protein [Thiotrichales bacterium]